MVEVRLCAVEAQMAWIQDLGRSSARDGLATNGALDQYSARMANALVGNGDAEPLIESVAYGLTLRASHEVLVAICGAARHLFVDGILAPAWQPVVVPAGATLHVPAPTRGIRSYLAVRGTWRVERWAGSAAPDRAIGVGRQLSANSELIIERDHGTLQNPWLGVGIFRPVARARQLTGGGATVDLIRGPDLLRFAGLDTALERETFTVDTRTDHVGMRLRGTVPMSSDVDEVLSHGVPAGAVEITPSRELIVLLRGRSLTAGYPIIGFVSTDCLDTVGQLAPGDALTFGWSTRDSSLRAHRRTCAELTRVRGAMRRAIKSVSHEYGDADQRGGGHTGGLRQGLGSWSAATANPRARSGDAEVEPTELADHAGG